MPATAITTLATCFPTASEPVAPSAVASKPACTVPAARKPWNIGSRLDSHAPCLSSPAPIAAFSAAVPDV